MQNNRKSVITAKGGPCPNLALTGTSLAGQIF